MSLELGDSWIWDFWFAVDGEDVHVFYLQAPRSLGDPNLRHHRASIGHAVSRDLRTWKVLPDALHSGEPGAFDDLATWTGSVLRVDDEWHMFYTGVSRTEGGRVQRVGRASSTDLVTWVKHGQVLEADPQWYETLADGPHEEAWRDPWVWWDQSSSQFHMLL
ncbi:MAG: glycosyl hydrolase family 32, partial [Microcella sp.]|nr:glycosyl hydrolase family 32 [Microcella sp.]